MLRFRGGVLEHRSLPRPERNTIWTIKALHKGLKKRLGFLERLQLCFRIKLRANQRAGCQIVYQGPEEVLVVSPLKRRH